METLVFEVEEAFVASFEMVDGLVAIASITRFRSFTTAQYSVKMLMLQLFHVEMS